MWVYIYIYIYILPMIAVHIHTHGGMAIAKKQASCCIWFGLLADRACVCYARTCKQSCLPLNWRLPAFESEDHRQELPQDVLGFGEKGFKKMINFQYSRTSLGMDMGLYVVVRELCHCTQALTQDPRPLGLPEMLTVAHMPLSLFVSHLKSHGHGV